MITRHFKKYFLKDVPQRDRFLTADQPTQETFAKLFDSVAFIKEKKDRAQLEQQGLINLTPDAHAKSYTVPDPNCSYAVQPTQLPDVKSAESNGVEIPTSMPRHTIEVTKSLSEHTSRATWMLRLRNDFITWLNNRLIPDGGYEGDVLVKDTNNPFAVKWARPNNCKVRVFNVSGAGLDEEYDMDVTGNTDGYDPGSKYIAGGRRGRLYLFDHSCFFWFLTGNPDPSPYEIDSRTNRDSDPIATFREIQHTGAQPGCMLRLKIFEMRNFMGSELPNVLFREQDAFEGNIILGEFGYYDGGFRELAAYNGDTLTFVYHDDKKWYLVGVESPQDVISGTLARIRKVWNIPSTDSFLLDEGVSYVWATKSFYVPGVNPLPVKIDFSGGVDSVERTGLFTPNDLQKCSIKLTIDKVLVTRVYMELAFDSSNNATLSWVGGKDGAPLTPGDHDIVVELVANSKDALKSDKWRLLPATLMIS